VQRLAVVFPRVIDRISESGNGRASSERAIDRCGDH